jgi:NTE family protein
MTKKSVSLVLGSGGARGLAHIGVIRYLEENGYEIKSVSGCSMGALIGGF